MASESFGCHDISRRRWGASVGWESCCFGLLEGLPRSLWWLTASSGCTARGVGVTGRGWGALWVVGAFVQYAQPLVSGSRPSWSRPTRADSGRSRRRTMTTGTLCRQRAGSGGGGPMTEASGCAVRTPDSLLRGLVSTALTLPSLPANHPAEIVGILRFFLGEQSRLGVNVSAVDTDAPPDLFPSSCPRFQGHRPAKVPARAGVSEVMTLTCLKSEETAHETHRP